MTNQYPGGLLKAVTFSYDDGIRQDKKLISLMNKYGLKGTFNLNSGVQSEASRWTYGCADVRRMNYADIGTLYDGHEVASHCLTHADLTQCDEATTLNELVTDRENLRRIYKQPVRGLAYPYGTYNDAVLKTVSDCGFEYARTTESTHRFDIPSGKDLLAYGGTCHHNDPQLFSLAEEFIALKPDKPQAFYVWGHSYEFDADGNWDMIERFFSLISHRADIYYCTNYEALCFN